MKKIVTCSVLFFINVAFAQDAAIKKTIEDFFASFHAHDTVALKKTLSPELSMHSVSERNGIARLKPESVAAFLKSIATTPADMKFEEKLLSWEIRQDGPMAHVWTEYEFHINGKLSHSGVNSFSLVNTGDGWKIVYIVDTRRRS